MMDFDVLIALGAVSIIFGVAVTTHATRLPWDAKNVERCAGAFFLVGVTLISIAFPMI